MTGTISGRRAPPPEGCYVGKCPLCNPGGGGELWRTAIIQNGQVIAFGVLCDECEAWAEFDGQSWVIPAGDCDVVGFLGKRGVVDFSGITYSDVEDEQP